MPTISAFYGILLYAEFEVLIDIRTLEIIRGRLPRRVQVLVLEWQRSTAPD